MLKAFKNELINLSETSSESLIKRIKKQVPYQEVDHYLKELTNFIHCIPDLLVEVQASYAEPNTPPVLKNLLGYLLTYFYHPQDLIDDEEKGLLGYLDDAYLIGIVYSRLPINHNSNFSNLQEWLNLTKIVIPSVTKQLDQVLEELLKGNMQPFNQQVFS
ncbi:MAG: hypothetical protein SFT81_05960 [Candidatus Caenarcaniphilales bacterium]|nr:hypothetical protein [Candidatus Caenarcaniphilales bacterium]